MRNPGFLPEQLYPQLIWALAPCWPAQLAVPLDWTSAGGYELVVASLPWRGRALPLFAYACQRKWQGLLISRNHLALIRKVTAALRAARQQLRLGFARLSLFQFLVDAAGSTCPRRPDPLAGGSDLPPGPQKGLEPWYVVTILESPQQALAYYRRRMRIDEGFKDWKQRVGLRQAAVSTVVGLAPVGASQAARAGTGAVTGGKLRRVAMIWKVERRQDRRPLTNPLQASKIKTGRVEHTCSSPR